VKHVTKARRPLPMASLLASATAMLALGLGAGCGRSAGPRGPAVEREETVAGNRVRLESRVEPRRVTLGDRAIWRLGAELSGPVAAAAALRDSANPNLDLSPRAPASARAVRGGSRWSAEFEARGFTLGPIPLPAVRLPVAIGTRRDTLVFPPDTLFVDSLTQASSGKLQPDRGAIATELRPIDLAVAAAVAVLVLGAFAWLVLAIRSALRRRRGEAAAPAAPPEPPETIFLRALERLRGEAASLPRDQFYDGLSGALRSYTARVARIPALDLTTSELARELKRDTRVDAEGAALLLRTLLRSDLAKFARQEDPLGEARAALEEASSLSGRLLRPEPPPQAGHQGAGTLGAPPKGR
jgi:hypothetical protein